MSITHPSKSELRMSTYAVPVHDTWSTRSVVHVDTLRDGDAAVRVAKRLGRTVVGEPVECTNAFTCAHNFVTTDAVRLAHAFNNLWDIWKLQRSNGSTGIEGIELADSEAWITDRAYEFGATEDELTDHLDHFLRIFPYHVA